MFTYMNPGSFFGPAEMLAVYKSLPVQTPGGDVAVSINNYRNDSHPEETGGTKRAWAVEAALIAAIPGFIRIAGGAQPLVDTITGKGLPESIVGVLEAIVSNADRFCTFHAKADKASQAALLARILSDDSITWQETVQQICDQWIGLDCNGFVGNWLQTAAPEFKLTHNSRPNEIRAKAVSIRTSAADIEYWDLMCYTQNEHVAAVNGNGQAPGTFEVCQSAGGGPRSNDYRFIQLTNDTFQLAAPMRGDIGRAFYVISLWPDA